jgi:hypothetical protein
LLLLSSVGAVKLGSADPPITITITNNEITIKRMTIKQEEAIDKNSKRES